MAQPLPGVAGSGVREVAVQPGARDLPGGELRARYPLGADGSAADKELVFGEEGITVTVRRAGPFVERIPLLAGPPELEVVGHQRVALARRGARWVLEVLGAGAPARDQREGRPHVRWRRAR